MESAQLNKAHAGNYPRGVGVNQDGVAHPLSTEAHSACLKGPMRRK